MKKFFMGMIALSVSLIFLGCPSNDDDGKAKSAAQSLVDQLGAGFNATGAFQVTLADDKAVASGEEVEIPAAIELVVPAGMRLTVEAGGTFSVLGTLIGAAGADIVVEAGASVTAAANIFFVGAVSQTNVGEGTYAWNEATSRWERTGVAATVGNVTIRGTAGTAGTTADVVITLVNDTFTAISQGDGLSSWFTELNGLDAEASAAVTGGSGTTVTITVSGTPSAASTAVLAIEIPAASLTGGVAVTVTENTNAKFNVTG
jgi:hypothetical protein